MIDWLVILAIAGLSAAVAIGFFGIAYDLATEWRFTFALFMASVILLNASIQILVGE